MFTGKCACGSVSYIVEADPMFVHCCHCSDCLRTTGSAFVINALIETDQIVVTGPMGSVEVDSPSGGGQRIHMCANCCTMIYSNYLIRGDKMRFFALWDNG